MLLGSEGLLHHAESYSRSPHASTTLSSRPEYLALITTGAAEHGLPTDYRNALDGVAVEKTVVLK